MTTQRQSRLALNATMAPGSDAESHYRRSIVTVAAAGVTPAAVAGGQPPAPDHDLRFHGGKILPDLVFANLYVGGEESWEASDVSNIDRALDAAMSDAHLNNVLVQYFDGQEITSSFQSSGFLPGPKPATVSRGDLDQLVQQAQDADFLNGSDLTVTVFNFLLPSGTILTTDDAPSGAQDGDGAATGAENEDVEPAPEDGGLRLDDDKASSTVGLAGYHGSVQLDAEKVYFAVGVFSEDLPDGTTNGIPVFQEPWKNVVATFYHELCEARTDPDVEEANRNQDESLLGWVSEAGEEIGDFALSDHFVVTDVIQEVPLTDGSGEVPVQFEYSNFEHGPEGPSEQPRPAIQ
jgi:hypothetical protein